MFCVVCVGTFIVPDAGAPKYCIPVPPEMGDCEVHEYPPDATLVIVIEVVVEECFRPLKVTLHEVPEGSPDSVKVTVLVLGFVTVSENVPELLV